MTRVLNSRVDFAAESLAGFVAANSARVRPAQAAWCAPPDRRADKVAIVIGGGSGHYPAFAGLVGTGLADGAVCGDVFASPSTRQVMDICRAVDQGAGVWLSFGNYAGDVLNFSAAAARLRAQGMAARGTGRDRRRGQRTPRRGQPTTAVAGDVVVFKVAGAAAERGYSLAEVAEVATRANERTRSFGAAFDRLHPARRRRAPVHAAARVGRLGSRRARRTGRGRGTAADRRRVGSSSWCTGCSATPGRRRDQGRRLLNGLGHGQVRRAVRAVAGCPARLDTPGCAMVAPEVGELVTSLDMAGCSLTARAGSTTSWKSSGWPPPIPRRFGAPTRCR